MSEWQENISEADTLCERGQRLIEEGKLLKAGECFESAVEIAPDYAEALFTLGNYYLEMGRPADASKMLQRALKRDPDNAYGYLFETGMQKIIEDGTYLELMARYYGDRAAINRNALNDEQRKRLR